MFLSDQQNNEQQKEILVLPSEQPPQPVPFHSIPWPKIKSQPSRPGLPKHLVIPKIRPVRPSGS
jgi:hypothetical protein